MSRKKSKPAVVSEPEPVEAEADESVTPDPEGTAADAEEAATPAVQVRPEEEPLQTQLLRLQADFDNYRKRTLREKAQLSERAIEELVQELLPIVDHFEMGLSTARQHEVDASVTDGFQLIYDQLMGVFDRFALKAIDAEGETFDPHRHEAATYIPSEEHAEGIVIAQTRRGYVLGDKLLRAAQVVVSSGSPAAPPAPAAAPDQSGDVEETTDDSSEQGA